MVAKEGEGEAASRGWCGGGSLQLTRSRGGQNTPDGGVVSYPRGGTGGLLFVALAVSSLHFVLLIP